MRLSVSTCPCCGQSNPGASAGAREIIDREISNASLQYRLAIYLLERFNKPVRREELINFAYRSDPNGGPENATKSIAVTLNRVRHLLRPHGLTIEGSAWGGNRMCWRDGDPRASRTSATDEFIQGTPCAYENLDGEERVATFVNGQRSDLGVSSVVIAKADGSIVSERLMSESGARSFFVNLHRIPPSALTSQPRGSEAE